MVFYVVGSHNIRIELNDYIVYLYITIYLFRTRDHQNATEKIMTTTGIKWKMIAHDLLQSRSNSPGFLWLVSIRRLTPEPR